MNSLGITLSEYLSRRRWCQGRITKTGNAHAGWVLVGAASCEAPSLSSSPSSIFYYKIHI